MPAFLFAQLRLQVLAHMRSRGYISPNEMNNTPEGKTMRNMIEGKEASGLVQGDVIIASNGEHRTVDVTCHMKEGFFVTYSGGGNDRFDASDLIDFPFPQEARY